jgi:4-amino-4-deoxy-L-arabinose transferase-like glycosyltransferase
VGGSRRFQARLGLIALGAAAWRIWYVVGPVMSRIPKLGLDDEFFYSAQARLVADGKGFLNPFGYFAPVGTPAHRVFPTAVHPPLYTVFLAVPAKLGLSTPQEQRIFTALLGVGTVVLIGLLGRKLAGDRVGLVAALIAAVYPALWVNDAMLGLETLYGFLVILALLAFYRLWQSPTVGNAALFALCLSLATLARSEGAMLFVLFALPTLLLLPRVATRRRLELFGVVVAVALVVVGPWAVRNLTTFEKPSLLGNGFGWVLLYGSCDAAFSGPHLGYWDDSCSLKNYPPDTEESVLDQMARTKALDYLGDHKSRVPLVVAARVGRIWDVYRPFQNVELNDTSERRGHVASWAVLIGYWLIMPFAIFGLVVLRRRRIPIFPYLAIALSVTITVALSFGITRYRAPVDVVLPVLAAVGLDAIWRHFRRTSADPAHVDIDPDDAAVDRAPAEIAAP